MLICSLLSSIALYMIIFSSISLDSVWSNCAAQSYIVFLAMILIGVKSPVFPFSLWLPEAHVEASWTGSVVLAGFALKFSILSFCCFCINIGSDSSLGTSLSSSSAVILDWAVVLYAFTVIWSSWLLGSINDLKKTVANLSVIHMAVTSLVIVNSSNVSFLINLSWHHHSSITGIIFVMIGFVYSSSGSRLMRFFLTSFEITSILCLCLFWLWSLTLDLPWTANSLVEVSFAKQYSDNILIIINLIVLFWFCVVLIICSVTQATGLCSTLTSNSFTTNNNTASNDISSCSSYSSSASVWLIHSIVAAMIGFIYLHTFTLHWNKYSSVLMLLYISVILNFKN